MLLIEYTDPPLKTSICRVSDPRVLVQVQATCFYPCSFHRRRCDAIFAYSKYFTCMLMTVTCKGCHPFEWTTGCSDDSRTQTAAVISHQQPTNMLQKLHPRCFYVRRKITSAKWPIQMFGCTSFNTQPEPSHDRKNSQ